MRGKCDLFRKSDHFWTGLGLVGHKVPADKALHTNAQKHWCRRRGSGGCNHTPKSFYLVKIRANHLKSGQNLCEFGKNVCKRSQNRCTCYDFTKIHPKSKRRRFFGGHVFI